MSSEGSSRRIAVPPPKCKAMFLCDQTIVDAETGKISLIGSFNSCNLERCPGYTEPFTIFVVLVEGGVGHDYEIVVEFYDLTDNSRISRVIGSRARWNERSSPIRIMMPMAPILIQHPGEYALVVLADDQEVDRQRLVVTCTPPA